VVELQSDKPLSMGEALAIVVKTPPTEREERERERNK